MQGSSRGARAGRARTRGDAKVIRPHCHIEVGARGARVVGRGCEGCKGVRARGCEPQGLCYGFNEHKLYLGSHFSNHLLAKLLYVIKHQ